MNDRLSIGSRASLASAVTTSRDASIPAGRNRETPPMVPGCNLEDKDRSVVDERRTTCFQATEIARSSPQRRSETQEQLSRCLEPITGCLSLGTISRLRKCRTFDFTINRIQRFEIRQTHRIETRRATGHLLSHSPLARQRMALLLGQ